MKPTIEKISNFSSLDQEDIHGALDGLLNGEYSPIEFGRFLSTLHGRGETPDEVHSFAEYMREHALIIDDFEDGVDVCGTGGDTSSSFNISTAAAFVIAGAGLMVAKHGNRAATSKSGSADVLEALGGNLSHFPSADDEGNFSFFFAPNHHPTMRHIAPIRSALDTPTVFNVLGPLLNPACVKHQIIGTPNQATAELIARTATKFDNRAIGVFYNDDGLDELSTNGANHLLEVRGDTLSRRNLVARDYGLRPTQPEDITGGTPADNAKILRRVVSGIDRSPRRDVVVLNAAYAIYIAERANQLEEAIEAAEQSIDSGRAVAELEIYLSQ